MLPLAFATVQRCTTLMRFLNWVSEPFCYMSVTDNNLYLSVVIADTGK